MATEAGRRGYSRVRRSLFRVVERFEPDETTVMVVVAVVVGLVGGFGAILFRWLVDLFQGLAIGHGEHTVALLATVPWWRRLLLPVVGGLIVGPLVHFGAREARGHGVPEVLGAMVFRKGVIRPVVAAVKIVASALTIAVGGSVGREGPIVQIGAAMGSSLGQWLRFSPQRLRTLIGCGAAAGIAATFNAPIAGAFFALEILMRDFAVVTFAPVIVASVTATAISREFLGDTPAFPVPDFNLGGPHELPLYIVLGALVGLLALVYVKSLYASEDLLERMPLPAWLQPAAGGVLLGLLLMVFPQVYGVGYGTMVDLLDGRLAGWLMLLLVVVKLLAVNVTLGSGFSGGIFAPALFLGGMLGGAFGALVAQFVPGGHDAVGAFAMVGMAAMVGAATGGPLTAILILFEMTGEYRVILPLMLASIGAALVYRSMLKDSIFTLKFARQGQTLELGRESAVLRDFHVQDIMDVNPVTLEETAGFDAILQLFLSENEEHYYVVDAGGGLVGRLTIHDVKNLLHERNLGQVIIAADIMGEVPHVVHRQDNLEDCLLRLGERDSADLPVLYSLEKPVLAGVIRRQAVFEVYNREVLHRQDTGIKLVTGEARMHDCVELPEQYKVQLLVPPHGWWGRTLRDLELRPRYGIAVLAIKRRTLLGGSNNVLPEPDVPLEPSDRLIIVGEARDLDRLLMAVNPRAFPAGGGIMKADDYYGRPRREMLPFIPAGARRVLDIGCGAGAFAAGLKRERGAALEVWGVEMETDAAGRAAEVLDHVLTGDVAAVLPQLSGMSFDVIVMNDVLEHLPRPGDVLAAVRPLLAPDGRLVASLPNVRYFANVRDLALHGRWEYTDEGILDRTHLRFFTRSSMHALFADAGYAVESQTGLNPTGSRVFRLFDLVTLGRFADMGYLQFACVVRPVG